MIIHNQDENSSQRKFIFKMKPYSQENNIIKMKIRIQMKCSYQGNIS